MESQRHLEVFAFTLLVIAACSDPTKSDPETHLEPDLSKETQDLALDALLDQEEADIVDQQDADIEPEVEFHDDHSELQEMDSDVADSDVLDSDLGDAGTSPWDNSVAAASLNPCAPWQSSCDGICHNLTLDEAACGACDNPCAADQVCDLGSCQSPAPLAAPCSAEVLAEVLAPASDEAPRVLLTCSLTLAPEDVVSKKIRLAGPEASGVVIDCQGATLRPNLSSGGADAIQIVSQKIDTEPASWQRPTDIVVRNCRIEGSIRISGQALNGEGEDLRLDSLTLGHRERAQAAAPSRILLNQLTLIGQGRIPLYLSPGSTRVTLQDSEIIGKSSSTWIYLDAESGHHRILRNRFSGILEGTVPREHIAIDGSAANLIAENLFEEITNGGVFIYRNCGEGGTVRHQEPHRNIIAGNVFFHTEPVLFDTSIWIGSRNLTYWFYDFCDLDAGYDFGSSASDLDFAEDNVAVDNLFVGGGGLNNSDHPNWQANNLSIPLESSGPTLPQPPVCVIFRELEAPLLFREGEIWSEYQVRCVEGRLVELQ